MKKLLTIFIHLSCMIIYTGCSSTTTSSINMLIDEENPDDFEQVDLVELIEEVIEEIVFGVVDTGDFDTITTDEYSFKYNADVWNAYSRLEINENELVDTNVVLENDVVKIIGSDVTYLSNTTSQEYFGIITASIPSMPLTGVDILATNIYDVNGLSVALIETKAGFTKDDIETLIYKQVLSHENVNAIGGLNNLDYKPMLSQFLLIICDDEKAFTFASSFANNPNSSYFNNYYRNLTLQAFDSIIQTINTNIKTYDK